MYIIIIIIIIINILRESFLAKQVKHFSLWLQKVEKKYSWLQAWMFCKFSEFLRLYEKDWKTWAGTNCINNLEKVR